MSKLWIRVSSCRAMLVLSSERVCVYRKLLIRAKKADQQKQWRADVQSKAQEAVAAPGAQQRMNRQLLSFVYLCVGSFIKLP